MRSRLALTRPPPVALLLSRRARPFFSTSLQTLERSKQLPYTCDQVYAVVADVEAYKQFLPFCTSSSIDLRRGPDSFDATLSLGFLAFSETYTSRVTLQRPVIVSAIAADTSLFSHLSMQWRFSDGQPPGTCAAHFRLEMQLKSFVHERAIRQVLDTVADSQVDAFVKRCKEMYGPPQPPQASRPQQRRPPQPKQPQKQSQPKPPKPLATNGTAAPHARLQIDSAWRHPVEAAFEAHAVDGELSLRGFVEACRELATVRSVARLLPPQLRDINSSGSGGGGGSAVGSGGGGGGGVGAGARHDHLRHVLSYAFFLEFDEDGNGAIDRLEFRNNLWMLTRASSSERMRYAFNRLDLNGSGRLERADLAASMQRQLRLVRSILPLLVRHELRHELRREAVAAQARNATATAANEQRQQQQRQNGANGVAVGAAGAWLREDAAALGEEAMALADSMIDGLSAQVDTVVEQVFAQVDVDHAGDISLEQWRAAWESNPEVAAMTGVEGLLALLLPAEGAAGHAGLSSDR